MKKLFSALGLFSLLSLGAQITVPFGTPKVDGKLDDQCWQKGTWQTGFTTLQKNLPAKNATRFQLSHNGHTLFIAIEATEPAAGELKKEIHIADSANIWMNDSFEIFISPDRGKSYCYHLIADSLGQLRDAVCVDNNAGGYKVEPLWASGAVVKSAVANGSWTMEIALPLGALQLPKTPEFTFNIVRNRQAAKPKEVSSFARNPRHFNLNPTIFVPIKLEKFNPALFSVTIDCPEAALKKTAKGFQGEFTLHTSSRSSKMQIVTTVATLLDTEKKPVASKRLRYEVEKGKFQVSKIKFPDIKPGNYLLDVQLTGSGSQKPLLAVLRKNISFDYSPLVLDLTYPKYRNSLFATMNDKKVRASIDFKELKGKPYSITVTGNGKTVWQKSGKSAPAKENISFDLAAEADGNYLVSVKCGDASTAVTVKKLPPLKGEVRVNENNVTLIDGKPFFPFGWYGNDDAQGAKSHINSILDTALYTSLDSLNSAFARREKDGVKMIIFPYQEFNSSGGWKIFSAKKRTGGLTEEQRKYLTEFIPKIRNNPALLAYYLADEPENRDNNPRWYKEVAALLRELDPYHPCIMLNWGIPGIRRFYESADILLPDCYPTYFENGTTGKVRHCSSQWAQAATELRPSWFMPLVASWPARNRNGVKGVPPTYNDLRSQFFQALIHNVKGFNMYAYFESRRFASLMIAPDAIGKTMMILKDLMLLNTEAGAVTVKTVPAAEHFQAGLKRGESGSAVIAVNTQMQKVTASFKVKNFSAKKLYVAGERRSITVKDGAFTDTFAPGETHIYLESGALADAVPTVAVTEKSIAALKAARKKPGNIIGQGEMLVADYIDYSEGKVPAGVPVITASSDPKNFFATAKTGSRYYLIDGLTDPLRPEYSWSPDKKDKNPWISIKLAKSAAIGEVKLYTPEGNLKSGSVVVNGKEFPFKNPANSDELIIRLNGITGDKVLIKFNKFKRGNNHRVNGRLLTEIEIYEVKKMDKAIVLPETTTPAMETAAQELKDYLAKTAVSIKADKKDAVFELVNDPALAEEQWEVRALGNGRIRVAGGGERGILYAVYNFLEKHIGVRWFSPTVEYLPEKSDLDLTGIKMQGKPFFRIRNVYRRPQAEDQGHFSARNRLNQEGEWPILAAKYGSGVDFGSPSHCHSIQHGYFPMEKFFKTNPEYYAIVDGKRNGSLWFGQICYSRPGLAEELIAKLKEFILADEAVAKSKGQAPPRIYDISINDSRNFCECPQCAEKVAKYNASGTVLLVLNKVAAALAEFRPDYTLQTLGYFATTEPPKGGVKPAKNLVVRVCNTETFLHVPITHPLNEKYRKQVESWAAQVHELFPWEYSITYGNGAGRLPYPSEFNIADNMRFYAANKGIGIFFEHENPDFNDLYDCKVWMEAKLMEDPQLQTEDLMKDFCSKFYGPAGKYILQYRNALREASLRNNAKVDYFFPYAEDFRYLNWETMKSCQKIAVEARNAAKGNSDLLHHVDRAFASLDYALISGLSWFYRMEAEAAGERDMFLKMYQECAERYYLCHTRSIDELLLKEKREVGLKARQAAINVYNRAKNMKIGKLPVKVGSVFFAPDCWAGRHNTIYQTAYGKTKAFCRIPVTKTRQGKIKFVYGRWNVSAQKAAVIAKKEIDLEPIKGKGPQMLEIGVFPVFDDHLILNVFERPTLNWRADWLRDRFDGKKVRLAAEVNWDGGKYIEIGVLEISEAK